MPSQLHEQNDESSYKERIVAKPVRLTFDHQSRIKYHHTTPLTFYNTCIGGPKECLHQIPRYTCVELVLRTRNRNGYSHLELEHALSY